MSRITNSDLVNNCSVITSTGNAPKNTTLEQFFLAEAIDDSVTANNRKRKRDKHTADVLPSTKNLTPVT